MILVLVDEMDMLFAPETEALVCLTAFSPLWYSCVWRKAYNYNLKKRCLYK